MKNSWLIKLVEQEVEEKRLHGKLIFDCHDGDIPSVEIHRKLLKPKEGKRDSKCSTDAKMKQ